MIMLLMMMMVGSLNTFFRDFTILSRRILQSGKTCCQLVGVKNCVLPKKIFQFVCSSLSLFSVFFFLFFQIEFFAAQRGERISLAVDIHIFTKSGVN
jgi:hypothetical protein